MITWIQIHIIEIFAVVGALYSAARVIVALTPTPKDDVALAKVWVGLKAIAKAFGLDLKQGVGDKSKPPPKTIPVLLLLLMLLPGCSVTGRISPEADLLIAQKTFAAVVRGLTDMQVAGEFEVNETEQLTILIHEGQKQLVLWEIQLREGQGTPAVIVGAFDKLIHSLVEFQLKGGV